MNSVHQLSRWTIKVLATPFVVQIVCVSYPRVCAESVSTIFFSISNFLWQVMHDMAENIDTTYNLYNHHFCLSKLIQHEKFDGCGGDERHLTFKLFFQIYKPCPFMSIKGKKMAKLKQWIVPNVWTMVSYPDACKDLLLT